MRLRCQCSLGGKWSNGTCRSSKVFCELLEDQTQSTGRRQDDAVDGQGWICRQALFLGFLGQFRELRAYCLHTFRLPSRGWRVSQMSTE